MDEYDVQPTRGRMLKIACSLLLTLLFMGPLDLFAQESIRINGSGSALAMLKPFIEAYRKAHRDVSFAVESPLGSTGALKALSAGVIDIAVVSKPPGPPQAGPALRSLHFGRTPLVIVTEKNVPVKTISTRELEDIYSGATTQWPGGGHIRVILRPIVETDTKILKGLSPGMARAVDKAHMRQGVPIAVKDPDSNEAVANTPGGIGTAGLNGVLTGKDPLKVLKLNGIAPAPGALAKGTYPLAKDIYFVTPDKVADAAAAFLAFMLSDKGRAIAKRTGVHVTTDRRQWPLLNR